MDIDNSVYFCVDTYILSVCHKNEKHIEMFLLQL